MREIIVDAEADVVTNHTETEDEVQALLDELGDDLEVDISTVDLSMPNLFELQVWTNRRAAAVRDANLLKLQAQANKRLNDRVAEAATNQFNALCWEIAIIDRRYPQAKARSREDMKAQAEQDEKRREQR